MGLTATTHIMTLRKAFFLFTPVVTPTLTLALPQTALVSATGMATISTMLAASEALKP